MKIRCRYCEVHAKDPYHNFFSNLFNPEKPPCPACRDLKYIETDVPPSSGDTCPTCQGKGYKENFMSSIYNPRKMCENCHGQGYIPIPKIIHNPNPPIIKKKLRIELEEDLSITDSDYYDIIKVINDIGKTFEKTPTDYNEKGEDLLRNHILGGLQYRTELSSTGETFNKYGKTDIILKHKNENVFIAECKIWSGKKDYKAAISQLLGYVTWRDSKTAIILFVKNKKISPVLDTIEKCTQGHPNFVEYIDNKNKSWFNYIFHIEKDTGINIKTAVVVFHIPKK